MINWGVNKEGWSNSTKISLDMMLDLESLLKLLIGILTWKVFSKFVRFCGGLEVAGCQVPTKTLSLTVPPRQDKGRE